LRGEAREKVLHLHGYYDRPDSVILDVASYADLLNSRLVEAFRQALSLTSTMIYVGCGGTFEDPHLPGHFSWQTPCDASTPLNSANALAVFTDIDPVHASDPDLPKLLQDLNGWPLAIVFMAHQARGESSLRPVLQRWHAEHSRMLTRGLAGDSATSLAVSLRVSIESPRMVPGALRLLQLLGQLPAGLAEGDVEDLGCGSGDARRLIEMGLVAREAQRLRLLPLIREYVRDFHPPTLVPLHADFDRLGSAQHWEVLWGMHSARLPEPVKISVQHH
jgi:hypothetical protein